MTRAQFMLKWGPRVAAGAAYPADEFEDDLKHLVPDRLVLTKISFMGNRIWLEAEPGAAWMDDTLAKRFEDFLGYQRDRYS